MKVKDVPIKTIDGLILSHFGRVCLYAKNEIDNIVRDLAFSRINNEKELIEKLNNIIIGIIRLKTKK